MITLEKSLAHMAWSNQKFFEQIMELPEEIYGLKIAENEWRVGKILNHFFNAGEWFRFVLDGTKWTELEQIRSHEVLRKYQPYMLELDNFLIAESRKPDRKITFKDENGPATAMASTVLSQAVSHTAEHKGQISTILAAHGFSCSLDPLDVWTFESEN